MNEFIMAFDAWLASPENVYGPLFTDLLAARARLRLIELSAVDNFARLEHIAAVGMELAYDPEVEEWCMKLGEGRVINGPSLPDLIDLAYL